MAESLFEIQSDLAEPIARSLKAELVPGSGSMEQKEPPTRSLEAYRLQVQGAGWELFGRGVMRGPGSVAYGRVRRYHGSGSPVRSNPIRSRYREWARVPAEARISLIPRSRK